MSNDKELFKISINSENLLFRLEKIEKDIIKNGREMTDYKNALDRVNLIKQQIEDSLIKIEASEGRLLDKMNTISNIDEKINQIEKYIENMKKSISKNKEKSDSIDQENNEKLQLQLKKFDDYILKDELDDLINKKLKVIKNN